MAYNRKWDTFDLEYIGEFIDRNLAMLGYDTKMDPKMLREILDADGVMVDADSGGWFIARGCTRNPDGKLMRGTGVVVAQLSRRDILNRREDAEFFPDSMTIDPARKVSILVPGGANGPREPRGNQ